MMATTEEEWSCSACTFANHPDLILCEICGTDRSDKLLAATSIASQEQMLKAAGLSVSSVPFVPKDSMSHRQPEVTKKDVSVSSATYDPVASPAAKILPQQQAEKKTLSVSSASFDPSWREKMWGPLPPPTSTTTSTSSTQQNSISQRGNAVPAMNPASVYHHPMNMMPPPMTMPSHGMPMVAKTGQVINRYHSPILR